MERVLIISNPKDKHTQVVAKKVQQLGAYPVLFYPENLSNLKITWLKSADKNLTIGNWNEDEELKLGDFYSIWLRRPQPFSSPTSEKAIHFAQDEWNALLEGIFALSKGSLWVSHPDQLKLAARKPVQLVLAEELGIETPKTLITNDSYKAKEFFELCSGKVICKPTGRGWVYSEDEEHIDFVLTNRVDANHLSSAEGLNLSPVTFQEEIPKAYEIRVNVVGQNVLAIKIDSQNSSVSELDWRRYDFANTHYSSYKLPSDLETKCLSLVQQLGLEFGAIDIIRRPDGRYTFLEINGNGQFLWAEELSGVDVSSAIARLLSGAEPPLKIANLTERRK